MSKLIGLLVLIIGILLILPMIPGINTASLYLNWIVAILVLIIGIVKLVKKK